MKKVVQNAGQWRRLFYDFPEDGKICSSVKQTIQDTSIEKIKIWSERNFTPNSNLISHIYLHSKINLDDYYKTCAIIASESSNNQKIIDELEYYVFNNLMVYFKEIAQNKSENNGGTDQENAQLQANNQFSNSIRNSKSMLKPNISNLKSFKKH